MLTGEKSTEVAHYYCELAERARVDGDLDLARQHLKSSVRSAGGAFRGILIRAAIAQEEEDYSQALRLYEQALEADRRLMVEVLPELVTCYRETGREQELESYLQTIISKDGLVKEEIAYAAILSRLAEPGVMADCMENFILKDDVLASILDADRIAELPSQERQAAILRIADGLRRLANSSPRYRCTTCGYNSQRLVWHCPSCKSWESIRPLQKFQFEGLITSSRGVA
jgi:lipopolysaccharide biosynthesis regulator YciM